VNAILREPPRRILVLCTRRLGDVLLTTPLLRSLRRAWPQAELDVVTLRWSAPALEGNPDIQRIIAMNEHAGMGESLRAVGGLRRYDLALSTLISDRTHLLAFWSGRRRANLVPPGAAESAWWKRGLSTAHASLDGALHTVIQYLRLADCLGIPRHYDVVPPRAARPHAAMATLPARYAVIHPAPMYAYKRWPATQWRALARWLAGQGLGLVFTGGPSEAERAYVNEIAGQLGAPATNLAGQLSFGELTSLIEQAAVFVGPDTSVTHLAAATGVPVVTPYGPTWPLVWGPWPRGLTQVDRSPWQLSQPWQHQGNVWLLQGIEHCVPCGLEGCERHRDSRADCLDRLPASRVIAAVERALTAAPGRV
jgi:heptosyltransferase-3